MWDACAYFHAPWYDYLSSCSLWYVSKAILYGFDHLVFQVVGCHTEVVIFIL